MQATSTPTRFELLLFDKRYRWIGHVLFWMFIYVDELMAIVGLTPELEHPLSDLLFFFGDILMIYINLYVLIPLFLQKRKYLPYVFWTFLLLALSIGASVWYNHHLGYLEDEYTFQIIIQTIILNVTILSLAVALKLFKINYQAKDKQQKLQKMQMQTELAFLKYQLNPHFLFNALNSLYVLSQKKSEKLDDAILDLSELLRYQTYDSQKTTLPLKKELDFISNYYNFEKLRRTNIDWTSEVEGPVEQVLVPPMLIFPLAENAVKYSSASDKTKSTIKQKLNITEDFFIYTIENNVAQLDKINKEAYSGLGLTNLKRRLELLFRENYTLDIQAKQGIFKVILKIPRAEFNKISL